LLKVATDVPDDKALTFRQNAYKAMESDKRQVLE
jgi:hypothetical protein